MKIVKRTETADQLGKVLDPKKPTDPARLQLFGSNFQVSNGPVAKNALGGRGDAGDFLKVHTMKSATSGAKLPEKVVEVEHFVLKMSDGRRVAARVWLPMSAKNKPTPAILMGDPYGKDRAHHTAQCGYLAANGIACVRIDVRGSGASEGVLDDEYTERELKDLEEVIQWISDQPWSNDKVGMMGSSWAGFNTIKVAARKPDNLAAIIPMNASEDGYVDDAHYKGGVLLTENFLWGTYFLADKVRPPDPARVGDQWRSMWLERLEGLEPPMHRWLRKQNKAGDDNWWKTQATNLADIKIPVYAVGGWADGYTNAVGRAMEQVDAPKRGLIGPQGHGAPHNTGPGPNIGFLQDAIGFLHETLGGEKTGTFEGPKVRVWMQESVRPHEQHGTRPGRWVAEDEWPPKNVQTQRYYLGSGSLTDAPSQEVFEHESPLTLGQAAGKWTVRSTSEDQSADDANSLVFELPPLKERTEILGGVEVNLRLSAQQTKGNLVVRLTDVAPDGTSTRVTYGMLNLTHRDGDENPADLKPGQEYNVSLKLDDTAYAFPPGHKVRLAVSNAYWPMAWPAAEHGPISISSEGSSIDLPVRPPRAEDETLSPFEAPDQAQFEGGGHLRRGGKGNSESWVDQQTGEHVSREWSDGGNWVDEKGRYHEMHTEFEFRIKDDDPLSAVARSNISVRTGRDEDDWHSRIDYSTTQRADAQNFYLTTKMTAYEGEKGDVAFEKEWSETIPRA